MSVKASLKNSRRGDSMIEIIFSITVFCVLATAAIAMMNSGVAAAQASLETIMARNEIDAQAEALRFIHNSFLSEREYPLRSQQYRSLWKKISNNIREKGLANLPWNISSFNVDSCNLAYQGDKTASQPIPSLADNHAFVLNTRLLMPEHSQAVDTDNDGIDDDTGLTIDYKKLMSSMIISADQTPNKFQPAKLYPRLIYSRFQMGDNQSNKLYEAGDSPRELYRQLQSAEGIWVLSVRDATKLTKDSPDDEIKKKVPDFFDFHIRTCWYAPGRAQPSTIGTIIRLYNPEVHQGVEEVYGEDTP